jgi:hypothetical protein
MHEKSKKSIKSMLIIFSIAMVLIVAGCVNQTPEATNISTPQDNTTVQGGSVNKSPANNTTTTVTNISIQTAPSTIPPTIKCELCHTNPQNLAPHVNGGKLCINCHGSQVHSIHVGQGTVNLDCQTCHGFPPTIPKVKNGTGPGSYSVCEQCHAPPPNSTQPSNGNLIVIHLSRGKYCTNCHGNDITAIHAGIIANATRSR